MSQLEPKNRPVEEDLEEGLEGVEEAEDQSKGPAIPDDVRKRLLASWKLEE